MKIQSTMATLQHQEGLAVHTPHMQLRSEKNIPSGTAAEQEPALTKAEIEATLQQLNREVEAFNIGFRFKLHEESNRYIFQVVNLQNNEVLKEIPPQKMLDLAAQIDRLIGLLLDDKR